MHITVAVLGLLTVAALAAPSPASATARQRPATKPLDLEIRLSDVKGPTVLPDAEVPVAPSLSTAAGEVWRERAEQLDRVERPEIPNRRRASDGDSGDADNLLDRITIPLFRVKMQPSL